jgi:O-acetyl-ADP-ribose deacetylase (regulator of RNase III)
MKVILAAVNPELAQAWESVCGDLDGVSVHRGPILDARCDAVVSPTDTGGSMTGGINLHYSARFGWQMQERLQALIRERHHGELAVGSAEIIPTDNPDIPYLIAAPLRQGPAILKGTNNPYLAARAALLLVKEGRFHSGRLEGEPVASVVFTLAFPGLGTGGSRVDPTACAEQMRAAIEEVVFGRTAQSDASEQQ